MENTKINLCETCKKCMPSCGAEEKDVKFGDGVGNDNIYECSKYDKQRDDVVTKNEMALLFSRRLLVKHMNGKNSIYTPDVYGHDEITAYEAILKIDEMLAKLEKETNDAV